MPQGKIKLLVPPHGFGVIQSDSGDVFFHRSMVQCLPFTSLVEGQGVEFAVDTELHPTGQGASASRVLPLEGVF